MTVWLGERARLYSDEAGRLRDIRVAAVELRNALQSAESSQRGFLVGGNEIYLAPYDNAKSEARTQLARVQQTIAERANIDALLARLSAIVTEKIDEMDHTISFKAELKDNEAIALFRQQSW